MELQKIHREILNSFEKLNKIKQTIREWYTKYLSMHKNTELFDSFLYQLKLFDLQYEQYQKNHQFILNRLYGDLALAPFVPCVVLYSNLEEVFYLE